MQPIQSSTLLFTLLVDHPATPKMVAQ
ncbi:hypothetical protein AVDCRST_MAG94-1382, partial [uncultured Leptolyngbya sp.]